MWRWRGETSRDVKRKKPWEEADSWGKPVLVWATPDSAIINNFHCRSVYYIVSECGCVTWNLWATYEYSFLNYLEFSFVLKFLNVEKKNGDLNANLFLTIAVFLRSTEEQPSLCSLCGIVQGLMIFRRTHGAKWYSADRTETEVKLRDESGRRREQKGSEYPVILHIERVREVNYY